MATDAAADRPQRSGAGPPCRGGRQNPNRKAGRAGGFGPGRLIAGPRYREPRNEGTGRRSRTVGVTTLLAKAGDDAGERAEDGSEATVAAAAKRAGRDGSRRRPNARAQKGLTLEEAPVGHRDPLYEKQVKAVPDAHAIRDESVPFHSTPA